MSGFNFPEIMPLSELFGLVSGNLESSQKKPSPSEVSSREENDLVELLWENGQIKMHSQSNKATRRSSIFDGLPSSTNRACYAGAGHTSATRVGKFCGVQSILDDIAPVVPLGELDLSPDDDMAPWLRSCAVGDTLPQDYGSEFLTGMSGVTANGMSAQSSFVSVGKRSASHQTVGNLQSGASTLKASSSTAPMLSSWASQPCQTSDAFGTGVSDIINSNNASNHSGAVLGNVARGRDTVNGSPSVKAGMQKKKGVPVDSLNMPNFSLFSRPAVHLKAQIPSSDVIATSASPTVERMEVKETGSSACANNLVESMRICQSKDMPKDINFHATSPKFASTNRRHVFVQAPEEACPSGGIKSMSRVHSCKKDEFRTSGGPSNSAQGVPNGQRAPEPMAASSSVCSGNGANQVSGYKLKRTFCDNEDSECPCSDDFETESTGFAKPVPGRGSGAKRSRAAEVHNLSERRRRDRINEKMRALQELIPNCSKVDKASMLDEAIEYLKTLQVQVQIMSMGAGLCMPPVMFPPGMQHIRPAQIPHFPPMGVGMGMGIGMGYGMGMPEMNGRTTGCPNFPVHPMQAARYPSLMLGVNNFQRVPAPIHPLYGHLNQAGVHYSVPGAPVVPLAGQHPINSAMGLNGFRNGNQNDAPGASSNLSCGDPVKTKNAGSVFNAEASSSKKVECSQPNTANEAFNQSTAVQENGHAFDARKPAAAAAAHASTNAENNSKEAGCD